MCLQCRRPGFDPWVGKIPWPGSLWLFPFLLQCKAYGGILVVPAVEAQSLNHWTIREVSGRLCFVFKDLFIWLPAVSRSPVLIYVARTADFLVPPVQRCGLDASPGWVVRPSVGLSAGCRPSFPRALLLFPLPPCVCPSVSGTQKVGLPKSEFLAPATRLWSRFRPSSTLPSNSFAVQHRVLLREKALAPYEKSFLYKINI